MPFIALLRLNAQSLLHGFAEGTKFFEVEACRVSVFGSVVFEIISTVETCVIWVAPHEILTPASGAFRFIVGPEAAATDLLEFVLGQGQNLLWCATSFDLSPQFGIKALKVHNRLLCIGCSASRDVAYSFRIIL